MRFSFRRLNTTDFAGQNHTQFSKKGALSLEKWAFKTKAMIIKMKERSCGTVPYTVVRGGSVSYLLVRARGGGYCGFPKGHVENGENETETALRETFEETSVRVVIDESFRREIVYRLSSGVEKTVVYFLASFEDQTPKRNKGFEDFEYLCLPFDEAYRALTFENTRRILKEVDDLLKSRGIG